MSAEEAQLARLLLPAPPPQQTLQYGAHQEQRIDIWQGAAPAAHRPLVMLLHGGFWRSAYDRAHMAPMAAALAAAGWSCANVEYRREPGRADRTVRDVAVAAAALSERLAQLPCNGSMIVAGFSAGGHLALWLAAESGLPALRGALALAPVADLRLASQLGLSQHAVEAFLGVGTDAAAFDPVQRRAPRCAVTIVHGEQDDTVPIRLSENYRDVHPATRCVRAPDAGHFALIDPQSGAWPLVVRELQRLQRQSLP